MQEDSDFLLCTNTQICEEEKKSAYRSFSIEPKQEMTSRPCHKNAFFFKNIGHKPKT